MELDSFKLKALRANLWFNLELRLFLDIASEVTRLRKRIEKEPLPNSRTSKHLNMQLIEAIELQEKQRQRVLKTYDVALMDSDAECSAMFVPQPASYFPFPANTPSFDVEDIVSRLRGEKVLNPETKDRYIRNDKYLLLKVDLTYDKEEIKWAVDDLVQHAQTLTAKESSAKAATRQRVFGFVFEEHIMGMSPRKACDETARYLEDALQWQIDGDSLYRRYYPIWKRQNGVSNVQSWRKCQKDRIEAWEREARVREEYIARLFREDDEATD